MRHENKHLCSKTTKLITLYPIYLRFIENLNYSSAVLTAILSLFNFVKL